MIVPTPELWTAGEEPDADTFNKRVAAMQEFLLEPPQAYAVQDTTLQSIPSGTWTKVQLDTTIKDNDGIVDLTNDKFVIQTPGWYEVVLGVGFGSVNSTYDPVGRRVASVRLNGVTANGGLRGRRDTIPDRTAARTCRTGGSLHAMFLNKNDYIELMAWQDSGVARNTDPGESNARALLAVRWVSN